MRTLLWAAWFLVILIFGFAQFVAGYQGIEYHFGAVWAGVAVGAALALRIMLPVTIGSFFGAMDVWGWHWAAALVFAAPGLALMIPGSMALLWASIKDRFKSDEPRQHVAIKPVNTGPTGVGGWLAWLIFCLMVLSPLLLIGSTFRDIAESESQIPALLRMASWGTFKATYWSIVVFAAVASFYGGNKLRTKFEPDSVRTAMWAIWIAGPLSDVALIAAAYLTFGEDGGQGLARAMVVGVLRDIIGATVWTLYLRMSRRVRNTYHHILYDMAAPAPQTERREPTL